MALMSYETSTLSHRATKQLEIKTQNSVLVLNFTCTIKNHISSLIASQERNFVLVIFAMIIAPGVYPLNSALYLLVRIMRNCVSSCWAFILCPILSRSKDTNISQVKYIVTGCRCRNMCLSVCTQKLNKFNGGGRCSLEIDVHFWLRRESNH